MPNLVLAKKISSPTTSNYINIAGISPILLQFSPSPFGFSGEVLVEMSFVPNPTTDIYYPIASFKISPWFEVADLVFSAQTTPLVFTITPPRSVLWFMVNILSAASGWVSIYAAFQ